MLSQSLPLAIRSVLLAILGLGLGACNQLAGLSGPTHQFVLQADIEELNRLAGDGEGTDEAVVSSLPVISKRLESMGVTMHHISHQGEGRIAIETSGLDDAAMLRAALGIQGDLALRMVDTDALIENTMQGIARPGSEILQMADGSMPVAVKRLGGIKGRHIIDARQGTDEMNSMPIVLIALDNDGAKKLAQLTSANIGEPMAIVLDGEVITAPIINEPILGGGLQIAGNFTDASAGELAIMLQSGVLPVPFKVLEERLVE